jgi:hypothetical protein
MNDVSGCWENVNGATALPVVGVKKLGGSAVVGVTETDAVVPIVLPVADMEVVEITDPVEVPGAI